MLIVTSRHAPDLRVIETIAFENPVQACFMHCDPKIVFVIEGEHPRRHEALTRDELIIALSMASQ